MTKTFFKLFSFFIASIAFVFFAASPSFADQNYGFELQGINGPVSDKDFKDKYLLVSFGYTSCPDICPTTLYELDRVLKKSQNSDKLQVVFISIDPEVDTPKRIQKYAQGFNPEFVGLTGKYSDLKKLVANYGGSFGYRVGNKEVRPPDLPAAYTVYHSTLIYLLSPDRQIIDAFDYQEGNEKIVKEVDESIKNGAGAKPVSQSDLKDSSQTKSSDQQKTSDTDNPNLPKGFAAYSGPSVSLSDFGLKDSKKPTLVTLWAGWCIPCHKELPLLDKLAASDPGLDIQPVNYGESEKEYDPVWQKLDLKHLQTSKLDDDSVFRKIGGVGLPMAVLFDQGKPIAVKNGEIKETDSLLSWTKKFSGSAANASE